jgi:hypothetical protein
MVALFAFNSMAKIGFAQICECPRLGIIIAQRRRNEDRKRVAGGQDYEVRYESKKTGGSKKGVKRAVKRVGNSRKKVEQELRQ